MISIRRDERPAVYFVILGEYDNEIFWHFSQVEVTKKFHELRKNPMFGKIKVCLIDVEIVNGRKIRTIQKLDA